MPIGNEIGHQTAKLPVWKSRTVGLVSSVNWVKKQAPRDGCSWLILPSLSHPINDSLPELAIQELCHFGAHHEPTASSSSRPLFSNGLPESRKWNHEAVVCFSIIFPGCLLLCKEPDFMREQEAGRRRGGNRGRPRGRESRKKLISLVIYSFLQLGPAALKPIPVTILDINK